MPNIFSLFPQDLYIYISQDEAFSDFNNTEALFWFHRDLVYGDWTTGENGDGCYEQYKEMDIPEVGLSQSCHFVWRSLKSDLCFLTSLARDSTVSERDIVTVSLRALMKGPSGNLYNEERMALNVSSRNHSVTLTTRSDTRSPRETKNCLSARYDQNQFRTFTIETYPFLKSVN